MVRCFCCNRLEIFLRAPPFHLGVPAEHAQVGAGGVHEHPVAAPVQRGASAAAPPAWLSTMVTPSRAAARPSSLRRPADASRQRCGRDFP